jgi:hypothetical protein
MIGAAWSGMWAHSASGGVYSAAWTFQVTHPGWTRAEVALTSVNSIDDDDGTLVRYGISQVVSDAGVENFTDHPETLGRNGMTSITLDMLLMNTYAQGRLARNFW